MVFLLLQSVRNAVGFVVRNPIRFRIRNQIRFRIRDTCHPCVVITPINRYRAEEAASQSSFGLKDTLSPMDPDKGVITVHSTDSESEAEMTEEQEQDYHNAKVRDGILEGLGYCRNGNYYPDDPMDPEQFDIGVTVQEGFICRKMTEKEKEKYFIQCALHHKEKKDKERQQKETADQLQNLQDNSDLLKELRAELKDVKEENRELKSRDDAVLVRKLRDRVITLLQENEEMKGKRKSDQETLEALVAKKRANINDSDSDVKMPSMKSSSTPAREPLTMGPVRRPTTI
jgi:hypothetical protein